MQWLRNAAYILIVILGGGFLLLAGREILFPFLFAMFFAFLLMPLERKLYKRIPNKAISITASVLIVLACVVGIVFLFGYQFVQIVSDMKSIQQQLKDGVVAILAFIEANVPFVQLPQDEQSMNEMMSDIMTAPFDYIGAGITSGAGFLLNAALTFIYTIFILIYKDAFKDFLMIQFAKDKREEISEVFSQSVHLIQRYLVGMVTVIIILAVMNCVGLLIIGVEHAIFWGVLAACLVIIPYIGTTIGGTLPFLYSLATADYSWQPFAVVVMYVIIQQIEGNIITPKIVGSSVRINPLFALVGIVIMGSLMGIGGIVLAIPILAVLKLIAEEIDVLKPIALLMDKDLMKKRHLFLGKYDRDDYRLSSVMQQEEGKR